MEKISECKSVLSEKIDSFKQTQKNSPIYMELLDINLSKNVRRVLNKKILKKQEHIEVQKCNIVLDKTTVPIVLKKFPKKDGKIEYDIGRMINGLKNEILNFGFTFESDNPSEYFMLEYINGDSVFSVLETDQTRPVEKHKFIKKYTSIILQVYIALFIACSYYGFVHNDLHGQNVMIVKFPQERWVTYYIRPLAKTVSIYTRYFPVIIDYGLCQIQKQDESFFITSGFSGYDLTDKYCIQSRDYFKFMLSLSSKSSHATPIDELSKMLFNDHPILKSIFSINVKSHLEGNCHIVPSYKKTKIDAMYDISYFTIINHLFSTLPSKIANIDSFLKIQDNILTIHTVPSFLWKDDKDSLLYKKFLYSYLRFIKNQENNVTKYDETKNEFVFEIVKIFKFRNLSLKQIVDDILSIYDKIFLAGLQPISIQYIKVLFEFSQKYQNYLKKFK